MKSVPSYPFAPLAVAMILAVCSSSPAQYRVDLTSAQTSLKDQGDSRRTCSTFGVIAALEAAYRRAYPTGSRYWPGREPDFSEEFLNFATKMLWLGDDPAPYWPAALTENQVGWTEGGNEDLSGLGGGLRVPIESRLPYRENGYTVSHPDYTDPWWLSQRKVDDFNLDTTKLRRFEPGEHFFGIGSWHRITATDTSAIEAELQAGKEVVWAFKFGGSMLAPTWQPLANDAPKDTHVMLIVGYDRKQHYFIVKNSWGKDRSTRDDGYTYISYSYVKRYGTGASVIDSVLPPRTWPEFRFIGRYRLGYGTKKGTLDIYHVPGIMQWRLNTKFPGVVDRRIGTFFDSDGRAYRVNGRIAGNRLVCWFDPGKPHLRWDEYPVTRRAVRFDLRLIDPVNGALAGTYTEAGTTGGAYGRVPASVTGDDGWLSPGPYVYNTMLGTWDVRIGDIEGTIEVQYRYDALLPAGLRDTHMGYRAYFVDRNRFISRSVLIQRRAAPHNMQMDFATARGNARLLGYRLEIGVLAGTAMLGSERTAFHAVAASSSRFASGRIRKYGQRCSGGRWPVSIDVTGTPRIGESLHIELRGVPSDGLGLLLVGRSRYVGRPFTLAGPDHFDCQLLVQADSYTLHRSDAYARVSLDDPIPRDRLLVGTRWFLQAIAIHPSGNTPVSEGAEVWIGGRRF